VSYSPEKNIGVVVVHNESGLIANELNGSISEIAYNMLTEQKATKLIDSHLKEMKENAEYVEKTKVEIAKKRDELRKRKNISLKLRSLLAGTYEHAEAGRITFKQADKGLYLSWGNLQSKVYPGKHEDELVLELRPGKFFDLKVSRDKPFITLKGWQFYKH
ncbi:MAG: hypothetical protein P8I03_02925, partial [Thalassotalea sp.]|nr:hypothetical protein [Thalassotalea sp.]